MVTPEGDTPKNLPLELAGGAGVLAVVAPPSPEEAAKINKLLERAMTRVLGRSPRVPFSTGEDQSPLGDLYENPAVQKITRDIQVHLDDGRASISLLAGWRRFLFAEQHGLPSVGKGEQSTTTINPAKPRQVSNGVVVEQVESLGSRVSSAVFMGPSRTHVMLERDSLWDTMNIDAFVEDLTRSPIPFAQFQIRIGYK